jgi:hypothetical protein
MIAVLLATNGVSQSSPAQDSTLKAHQKKLEKQTNEDRRINMYSNRKYSFGISLNPYAGLSNGNTTFYKSFNVTFSDRMEKLDLGKNGSLETNLGIGFEPYQGTKLNLGFDYELLSKKYKANLYIGVQYSLGLSQSTSLDGKSFINVGFNNYLMPFIGVMWWPGKEDITNPDKEKRNLYREPRFWQLFFVKLQAGYSYVLNKPQVDTIGIFDKQLYGIIRNNTSNTLNFKIGIGINIPTRSLTRYNYLLESIE